MPPPMTLETTMAAASRGPRRRSRNATVRAVTRDACGSFGDQRARHGVFAHLLPLDVSVLREELDLGVDKLRIVQHLLARLRPGISELRFDGLALRRRAGRQAFS